MLFPIPYQSPVQLQYNSPVKLAHPVNLCYMFTPRFTSYDLRDAAQQLVQPKPRADYPKRTLRLLQTFAGVLGEKIRVRAILKENGANYISLESLIKLRKKKIAGFFNSAKENCKQPRK